MTFIGLDFENDGKKIFFRKYNRDNVKKNGLKLNVRMYYCKNVEPFYINFIVFDDQGRFIEIRDGDIEKKKNKFPEEYRLFLKFRETIKSESNEKKEEDFFAEEVDSDDDEKIVFRSVNEFSSDLF